MKAKIVPISLYETDLDRLDVIVEHQKKITGNPASVNRSSVIRMLVEEKIIHMRLDKT